jgi:2-phospho-L-lactate/phosphoenolpyruvate guanylyltransferase
MAVTVDLVVPIKELARAKSRLVGATVGLAPAPADQAAAHADLALALASDTLAAVLASAVRRVAVVTADPRAAALAGGRNGTDRARVVADPGRGLNAAVRTGIADLRQERHDGRGHDDGGHDDGGHDDGGLVAALLGDLPALRPDELDDALAAAAAVIAGGAPAAFVADHTGEGTTLLVLTRPGHGGPHFGPGSAGAHAAAGAVPLRGDWPGLRHDVDVPADLDRVLALGAGPATRAWPLTARTTPLAEQGSPG